VAQPGIHRLPAGSRVADAIAAAGGYGPTVDLDATAAAINLARALDDGEQIRVPARGETHAAGDGTAAAGGGAADGASGGGAAGGLVDLNSATPEELEALPGIGPVTAQKIVAARQERPFSSLEDAVDRKAMNRGQLEQIRDLATAG
jgi:competence protein ComEA